MRFDVIRRLNGTGYEAESALIVPCKHDVQLLHDHGSIAEVLRGMHGRFGLELHAGGGKVQPVVAEVYGGLRSGGAEAGRENQTGSEIAGKEFWLERRKRHVHVHHGRPTLRERIRLRRLSTACASECMPEKPRGTGVIHLLVFPAAKVYRQLPLRRSFSAFVPEPKSAARPTEQLTEPKSGVARAPGK